MANRMTVEKVDSTDASRRLRTATTAVRGGFKGAP